MLRPYRLVVLLIWALVGSGALSCSQNAWAQVYDTERVIALAGEPSPFGPDFTGFSTASVNEASDVLFHAWLDAPGSGLGFGLFFQPAEGATRTVAVHDSLVMGPIDFERLSFPAIFNESRNLNASGELVFSASLAPLLPGPGSQGVFTLFRDVDGVLVEVCRGGAPAPAGIGGTLQPLSLPSIADSGEVFFAAAVDGGSVAGGIFVDLDGVISPLVLTGDASPETSPYAFLGDLAINASGDVVFSARLADETRGVFRIVDGVHSTVALLGIEMPNAGGTFEHLGGGPGFDFQPFSINASGDVAFGAVLTGGLNPPGVSLEGAFVREADGTLRSVAVTREPAPGTMGDLYDLGPSASAGSPLLLSIRPRMGDNGEVLFGAPFRDPMSAPSEALSGVGLFADAAGTDTLVFRTGDPAPGLPGVTLESLGGGTNPAFPDDLVFRVGSNRRNDVVFSAGLTGGDASAGLFFLPEPSLPQSVLPALVLGTCFARGGRSSARIRRAG